MNVRSDPNKKDKKIEFQVKMENEKQLRERIAKLDKKLTIKDDEKNSILYIDAFVDGKRQRTQARYINCSEDEALDEICKMQQEMINELALYFNEDVQTAS